MYVAPDEEPVYTYDYRGLRVRASSVGKAQDVAVKAENPVISQVKKDSGRPKSASAATNKLSVCKCSVMEYCCWSESGANVGEQLWSVH